MHAIQEYAGLTLGVKFSPLKEKTPSVATKPKSSPLSTPTWGNCLPHAKLVQGLNGQNPMSILKQSTVKTARGVHALVWESYASCEIGPRSKRAISNEYLEAIYSKNCNRLYPPSTECPVITPTID